MKTIGIFLVCILFGTCLIIAGIAVMEIEMGREHRDEQE
jgi:hypothetical protein